jgi:ABC-type antimicrobial peptide transport system permease subunit
LGARAADLSWLVVRDVCALIVVGIAIGSALSWAAVTAVESAAGPIVGVDLLALGRVALIILACGVAAAYAPTRRAVRTDPIAAIRRQ